MTSTELEVLKYSLLALINGGAIFRVAYTLMQKSHDDDSKLYNKRIRNVIVFTIMANIILIIRDMIQSYISL
jgi:hypothetical protein